MSVPGAPAYIFPCSNILAALRNCARDEMWALSTGDCVVLARFARVPSGQGRASSLIDALLEGIEVRLDTNYFENREAWDAMADKILFTGCIDEYFNYQCGRLEYRSLRFDHRHLEVEDYQGNAVVNYTAGDVPYTRVIEHKHFEYGTQPTTVITYEYPDAFAPGKEPYYPVNDARNSEIFKSYRELAVSRGNVLFGGRLAQYTYADMDDTVAAALALAKQQFCQLRETMI